MNIRYITTLLLALAATMCISAQRTGTSSDIAPFVSPQNGYSSVNYHFLPGGDTYAELSSDGKKIIEKDIKTGKEIATLFDVATTRENTLPRVQGFTISPNKEQILLTTDRKPVYRRSSTAKYYVYEVRSRLLVPLSSAHPRQQAPLFSPDSRMVAFVADNNIFIRKLDYGSEVQVTNDGEINKIINGIPDWTYEEEFTTNCSMTWAPDNLNLCFLKYDESQVPMYEFTLFEGTCNPKTEYALYPGSYRYKYPVAGQPNSKVSIHSYDVETRKIKQISLKDNQIEYIPRIIYTPDANTMLAVTLNRDQNRMEVYAVNPKSTVSKSILIEESKAWIVPESYEEIHLEKSSFVIYSLRNGFKNLYRYSYAGQPLGNISDMKADITAYYGTDALGNEYFQAAAPSPLDRTIIRKDKKGKSEILGGNSGANSISFNPSKTYAIYNHSDVSTPPVYNLVSVLNFKSVRVLQDNKGVSDRYAGKLQKKEFITLKGATGSLNAFIIKPKDFNPNKKYPVVMTQYSGPGSQQVLNRWGVDWEYYFANQGYIVVCVDGRGTGGRGADFMYSVYKQLGKYETEDQIAAARDLARLPYVDASKIGICGWSFGGYETLMCVTSTDSPFAAAVAIAPVTDWRYYDTVYAERYMLTPGQNEYGYRDSAPLNRTQHINCPVLLMHGTADDNVHISNTMEFVSKMQSQGIMGDMWLFPNMNHSINGCNARAVVYGKMFDYFKANL